MNGICALFTFRVLHRPASVVTVLLFAVLQICEAQTSWNPTSGPPYLWSNPSNWTLGVPIATSNVTISGAIVCTLDVNASIAVLTFSGNLDLNGHSLSISSNNTTHTFTNGSITNSGSTNSLSVNSTGSGGAIINGTTFGTTLAPGVNINANTTGTTSITIAGNAIFYGSVSVQSPDIYLNGATYYGQCNFVKTGSGVCASTGGNTYNGDARFESQAGFFRFPTTSADNFNALATFIQGSGAKLEPCYNQNCKFRGNVDIDYADIYPARFYFGSGTPSGAMEFVGSANQIVRDLNTVANGDAFEAPKIILNKTGPQTVTMQDIDVYVNTSATFTNGIVIMDHPCNCVGPLQSWDFTGSSTASGMSDNSFIHGPVRMDGTRGFTYPVGYYDASQHFYRPITLSTVTDVTIEYKRTVSPNNTSLSVLTNVSLCEYWDVSYYFVGGGSSSSGTITATLSWRNSDCGGTPPYVGDLTKLRVAHYNLKLSRWEDGGNTAAGPSTSGGTITSATINLPATGPFKNKIGHLTLGSTNAGINPLPIELSEFSAKLARGGILLYWKTATELDNDHFEIERSTNGIDFKKIGKVDGHGTTTASHTYSFLDLDPLQGLSYYRLRQVDFDGMATYSDVVSVSNFDSDKKALSVFPVPAYDKLYTSIDGDATIVDVLENVMFTTHHAREITVEALKPGIYFIMTSAGVGRFVKN